MERQGPSPPLPSRRVPDPLRHHRVGVPYLVLLSPLLVRLNWPLVATPRPDLAATAPSYSSGSRGHGGASAASRFEAGKGAGEAEVAALEPPPPGPSPKVRLRCPHTGAQAHQEPRGFEQEWRENARWQQGRRWRRQRPRSWLRSGSLPRTPASVYVTVSMEIPRRGQSEPLQALLRPNSTAG